MKLDIKHAGMTYSKEEGYVGKVEFAVQGHKQPYELILQSKKGNDWGYALYFLHESGPEEEIDEADAYLDDNDEVFASLVQMAKDTLTS